MEKTSVIRITEISPNYQGPSLLLVYMIVFTSSAIVLARKMRQHKSGYFLRPFELIYNGLFFGVYGVSVPIIIVLATSVSNMFKCDIDLPDKSDLRVVTFVYFLFVYLVLKLVNVMDILILLLTKSESRITIGHLMSTVFDPFILYCEMTYYPEGIIYFPVLLDSIVNMIKYGLSAHGTAGEYIKPVANWPKLVYNLRVFQYLIVALHSMYSLTINDCKCPLALRYFLSTVYLLLATTYLLRMKDNKRETFSSRICKIK